MNHWVMDYETLKNCFVAVFIHYKTDETKVFVVHKLRNDLPELLEFYKENVENKERHISFNGLAFDSQITEAIIRSKDILDQTPDAVARAIYKVAQDTIQRSNRREFARYAPWLLSIPQLDIFKMNHWDNPAKRSSLKWLQYAMDWHTVQEMPIDHTYEVQTMEELDTIISYCKNDVLSTKQLMNLSKPLIDVRKNIKKKYGLDCYNFSNTKMGSELLLKLYCKATGQEKRDVKEYRTYREQIPIKDILFPYVQFQSIELIGFYTKLQTVIIKNTKKDFKHVLNYEGYEFHYGAGGIHQCIEKGIYKVDDRFIIKDADVASQYPSVACENQMYPAHLGPAFFKVYKEDIVDVRLAEKRKAPEDKDMAIIEGFKEAANASYGNSNSEHSWLYDPQYTMRTTINGQLLITMLVEDWLLNIPEAQLLQTNTDGATLRFPKEYMPTYEKICKKWESITRLTLEFADYKAMYIWDVNNYIAQYDSGKTKCKGRFEWEDLQNHKVSHLSKNKSHLIVAKAIYNYLINDIVPEQYLMDNRNIYDYCAGVRAKGDWKFTNSCYTREGMVYEELQSTLRYYITNKGCKIIKKNKKDGREIQVEAGVWLQQEFNTYVEKKWEDYDVNESYYINQIYKELNNLVPKPKMQQALEFPE